eukprot:scaffold360_cov374-Pavlova_lutheri.AAC.79
MQGEGRSYRRLYEKIKLRNDARPKSISEAAFLSKEAKIICYFPSPMFIDRVMLAKTIKTWAH